MEVLPEERDRKYYADNYSCCPPPLFMIFVTLVEVSEPINWQLILLLYSFLRGPFCILRGEWGELAFSLSFVATYDHRQLMPVPWIWGRRRRVGHECNTRLFLLWWYGGASCISIERHSRRQQIGYSRLISHLIRNDHDKSCCGEEVEKRWSRGHIESSFPIEHYVINKSWGGPMQWWFIVTGMTAEEEEEVDCSAALLSG